MVPDAATNVVCGFLGCDLRPFNPLIATLPRLLHLPAGDGGNWIAPVLEQAVNASQNKRPGSEALLERLSEMMFVDAVSRYVDTLPESSSGWLAGLRDRHVGRALALLHAEPSRDWTIEELAGRGRVVALGILRAVPGTHRSATDAVPYAMADATRGEVAARGSGASGIDRARGRLRFRGGLLTGVQTNHREAARRMASGVRVSNRHREQPPGCPRDSSRDSSV